MYEHDQSCVNQEGGGGGVGRQKWVLGRLASLSITVFFKKAQWRTNGKFSLGLLKNWDFIQAPITHFLNAPPTINTISIIMTITLGLCLHFCSQTDSIYTFNSIIQQNFYNVGSRYYAKQYEYCNKEKQMAKEFTV
jgi:citrate synthase